MYAPQVLRMIRRLLSKVCPEGWFGLESLLEPGCPGFGVAQVP